MTPMERKKKSEVGQMIVLIFQISITMLVPILLCTFIGVFIGRRFGVNWVAAVAFAIGAIAGMQSVWRIIKKYIRNQEHPSKRDDIK